MGGQVVDGQLSGHGTYTYADGSVYRGRWQRGQQNGEGELTYADGCMYQGQFVEDAFQGAGVFKEGDYVYRGRFRKDLLVGEAIVENITDGTCELRLYGGGGVILERRRMSDSEEPKVKGAKDPSALADGEEDEASSSPLDEKKK